MLDVNGLRTCLYTAGIERLAFDLGALEGRSVDPVSYTHLARGVRDAPNVPAKKPVIPLMKSGKALKKTTDFQPINTKMKKVKCTSMSEGHLAFFKHKFFSKLLDIFRNK